MDDYQVLVLGGYGMAGLLISRLLLERSSASVIIAGRNRAKAEAVAEELAPGNPGRARGIAADASDAASLARALVGVDLIVDCTPTTEHVDTVTEAALSAGVDYLDILYGPGKIALLESKSERIRDEGRCFVTECGYHPGLPSALARHAADQLDSVDSVVVGGLLNQPIPYTDAVDELVRGLEDMKPADYRKGKWRQSSWSAYRTIDFGPPYGKRQCYAMDFHELHGLPEQYALSELGFYMAGWGWLIDWGVFMPWYIFKLGRIRWGAKLGAKLMSWLSYRTIAPPYGVVLKVEAEGIRGAEPARYEAFLTHADGYMLTAIPTVACILQLQDGSIRRPGLWVMGQAVDAGRLLADMESMGVVVQKQMVGRA